MMGPGFPFGGGMMGGGFDSVFGNMFAQVSCRRGDSVWRSGGDAAAARALLCYIA